MKPEKLIPILTLLLMPSLIFSCLSTDEPTIPISDKTTAITLGFDKRSPEDAIRLVNNLSQTSISKSRFSDEDCIEYKKVVDESKLHVLGSNKSRSSVQDTLIYAVNYANDEGFVLVSANIATEPILAIVDKGTFDENRNTNNEAFEEFLNLAENYVYYSSGSGKPGGDGNDTPDDLTLMWKTDTISGFYCQKPKIKVSWGQGWPANIYAPNKIAGCTPLAIAQALTFQRSITDLKLTFSEKDVLTTNLDWDNIVKHTYYIELSSIFGDDPISNHLKGCDATEKSHYDIGRLTRQLGEDLNSDYSNRNTTETNVLKYLSSVIKKYFPNRQILEYSKIENAYPVVNNFNGIAIISARDYDEVKNKYINGHTWVADATARVERYVRTFYDYNTVTGEYSSMETSELQNDEYLHFNWGWDGSFNGYFLLNVYNPLYGHDTITKDMPSPDYIYDSKYQALQLVFTIQ